MKLITEKVLCVIFEGILAKEIERKISRD